MSKVRGKDTTPEMKVRRLLHRLGYRYRLHARKLPGRPDIVFAKRKKVIFVHGCFWHRHPGCPKASTPKSKTAYWLGKFERNVQRDTEVKDALESTGWKALVIWECETKNTEALQNLLTDFLENNRGETEFAS